MLSWFGNRRSDDVEDRETSLLRLVQGLGQHVGRKAVNLRIELQRRHGVGRAGDLKVHVAERVFGAQDIGERDVLAVVVDQPHSNTGHGGLDGYSRRHEREGGSADRGHRRRTVRLQDVRHHSQGVRKVLLAGKDRDQGALREHAVTDFAALRHAHATSFAHGVGRKVVVVHVATKLVGRD